MNHYETVFILNPVLSETQIEEAVQKFVEFIKTNQGSMTSQENWGLKKLAYPIENKKSGFYHLFEYAAPSEAVAALEVEFRRDERIMRYLTVKLILMQIIALVLLQQILELKQQLNMLKKLVLEWLQLKTAVTMVCQVIMLNKLLRKI